MISVVLATYNSEKYLIKQLDSVINQTLKVDEIVIQDDCSSDCTLNILYEYQKKSNIKIDISKNTKNIGYIKTFMNAIKRCSGDIIILCDHDDIWEIDKVEIIQKTFQLNDDILALATGFIKIDENDKYIKTKKNLFHANNNLIRHKVKKNSLNKMEFKDVLTYNISPGCTCAFSNKLKKYLSSNNYQIPHDLQIMILASINNKLYYLDKVTTRYRIYSNNTIGLGHQTNLNKRLLLVKQGLNEKREILKLVSKYCNNSIYIRKIKRVIDVFSLRVSLLETRNILKYGFITLIKSFGLNKLYESILMDIVAIIKK